MGFMMLNLNPVLAANSRATSSHKLELYVVYRFSFKDLEKIFCKGFEIQ